MRDLLMQLNGPVWLIANLLYGTGMRLLEVLRQRLNDFTRNNYRPKIWA